MHISEINIYPVKSLKGIGLSESRVERRGLRFDRRWMLTDPDGPKKQYVPATDSVLVKGNKLLGIGQSDLIQFTAPTTPGDYPYICTFPGHWRLMHGVLKVK